MKKIKCSILIMSVFVVMGLAGCSGNTKEGIEYLEAKNYQAAVTAFEKDVADKKDLDEAYRGLGIAQYELGNYKEAIEAMEQALQNETKETATIYNILGVSCLKTDDYEKALEYYERALTLKDCKEPVKQEILYNEIAIYQELGEWDILEEKVYAYVKNYPDDTRMDKTAEFLETR